MSKDPRVEKVEELNVKQLEPSELPKTSSFVNPMKLGKVSAWKRVSFEYEGESITVECKKADRFDRTVLDYNIELSPEAEAFQKGLIELDINKPDDSEEIRKQMFLALTVKQQLEVLAFGDQQQLLRIVNRVRFPQEDGSLISLSLDGADGTANITEFERDFVEALDTVCDAINNPSEVKEALDTFPEDSGSE